MMVIGKLYCGGGYEFISHGDSIFEIRQKDTDLNRKFEASQIRKNKQISSIFSMGINILKAGIMGDEKCLSPGKNGRKKILKEVAIKKQDDYIQLSSAAYDHYLDLIKSLFPSKLLDENTKYGHSIWDALIVFKHLHIIAKFKLLEFPDNDAVNTIKSLLRFSYSINQGELIRKISSVTNLGYDKTERIINFLLHDGKSTKDLWCFPIIKTDEEDVAFVIAALHSPVLPRVVEHWLVEMDIDLSEKGYFFEGIVIDEINEEISNNPTIEDYEQAITKRFDFGIGKNEEIDLLMRVGNIILICECKSIVTADSPISLYRTNETLKKAADQVKRKSKFLQDNIEKIFSILKWKFDNDINYNIVPAIVTSNSICVGHIIDDIPVTDLKILGRYFKNNTIPLISVNGPKHLAWHVIYENFLQVQSNLDIYLKNPPQLSYYSDFTYQPCHAPMIEGCDYKILFSRLIKTPSDPYDLLKSNPHFPVKTVDNFNELIRDSKIFI